MDYCVLRRAENSDKVTVLLQKDRESRAIRSQVVESKGVTCEEAGAAALRGINEFGHRGKIIIKADGENTVKALQDEVLWRLDMGGFASQPVAREHESNGAVENGVKIFIDAKAQLSLLGTEMDFVKDVLNSEFVFNNPNIKGTCGCGESFTV